MNRRKVYQLKVANARMCTLYVVPKDGDYCEADLVLFPRGLDHTFEIEPDTWTDACDLIGPAAIARVYMCGDFRKVLLPLATLRADIVDYILPQGHYARQFCLRANGR